MKKIKFKFFGLIITALFMMGFAFESFANPTPDVPNTLVFPAPVIYGGGFLSAYDPIMVGEIPDYYANTSSSGEGVANEIAGNFTRCTSSCFAIQDPVPGSHSINGMPDSYTVSKKVCTLDQTSCTISPLYGAVIIIGNAVCPEDWRKLRLIMSDSSSTNTVATCKMDVPSVVPCCDSDGTGNPVHAGTGEKFQIETDYEVLGNALHFQRAYRSTTGVFSYRANSLVIDNSNAVNVTNQCFPARIDYSDTGHDGQPPLIPKQMSFCVSYLGNGSNSYTVMNGNGRIENFYKSTGTIVSKSDINDKLTTRVGASGKTEYVLERQNGDWETYDSSGRIVRSIENGGKNEVLYMYSTSLTSKTSAPKPGFLIAMTDHFGRSLNFSYDNGGRLVKMIDPNGGVFSYGYGVDDFVDVTSVQYPDGSKKSYLYNESSKINGGTACNGLTDGLRHFLTGIIDENGANFASFNYDCDGMAISTEHANGVEKYSFAYQNNLGDMTTTVIDPSGTQYQKLYKSILGISRPAGIVQPSADGNGTASSITSRDGNSNVVSYTDFNGVSSTYVYDLTRNLESSRTEAVGTPLARTTTTEWHSTFRIPKRIAEPLLITTVTHDSLGNVLTRTLQATTDADGTKAFAAAPTGPSRTWTYTWNTVGQILTATGPRIDVVDRTTYVYDAGTGNLQTITNAVGQVTKLSAYDANGRVGSIQDPNGAVTALTYTPRGWLATSATQGAGASATQTTTYTYDGVGQLKTVTFPAGEVLNYRYDDAHRLYEIEDSQNNKVTYALDNMGNHIGETVTDPNGTLARSVTRVMDALNRVKTVTGATL